MTSTDIQWTHPQAVDDDRALPVAALRSWRERGFALVDGLLPAVLIDEARAAALASFPAPGTQAASAIDQFGSGQQFRFPSRCDAVNRITLHPALLRAVSDLLDVPIRELRLTQSDLWPKYGRAPDAVRDAVQDNDDQRMHCDYPNHTLVHPPRWDAPEAVEMIVYYSDVADCDGATAVVPREGPDDPGYAWPIVATPGVGGLDYVNARGTAETYLAERAPDIARMRSEHLYPREVRARYRPGTTLLYRHDTWHRGTPVRPGALRLVHNVTFRKATSEWISVLHPGWAWSMYASGQYFERLIASASVEQRCVLGFPAPGAAYWTADTLAAVQARYGAYGIDLSPYAAGAASAAADRAAR